MNSRIVHKITPDIDPHEVLCTTYQMRNFYRQLGDGFFSTLDVMNYIQHHQIALWCKRGNHVLDVCCGRGLMLPLLRYLRKDLGSYTGIDINPTNRQFLTQRVTDGKAITEDYYPFPVRFVQGNVAEMSKLLPQQYEVIIYTSSIEHMQKDTGLQSLHECRKVSKAGTVLIVTCPNTPEDRDGFDTQYAAHVYEWKRSELHNGITAAGFQVITEYGLLVDKTSLIQALETRGGLTLFERLASFVPSEWLLPVFAAGFPEISKEIGFVCKAI